MSMSHRFWMVWNTMRDKPKKRHASLAEAELEAAGTLERNEP